MRYAPDIALQILKAMESHESAELPRGTSLFPDLDAEVYFFHCRLLEEADYISTYKIRFQGGVGQFWPTEVKYAGVQFLQMFEDESLWHRAKSEASSKGIGMALDTLKDVGASIVTKIISSQTGLG